EQERTATPSICTVQAPHMAMPQPYFGPVIPSSSRNTHSSGMSPSTFTSWILPSTVRRMGNPSAIAARRLRRVAAGDAPEGGAGDEARARGIIVVEQAAHHLAARVEAGQHAPVGADH